MTNTENQRKAEKWMQERYPAVLEDLEKLGHYRTMEGFGHKQFNFDRSLEP